jgi:hypothetical protein
MTLEKEILDKPFRKSFTKTDEILKAKDYWKLIIDTIKLPKESHLALSEILDRMCKDERQLTQSKIISTIDSKELLEKLAELEHKQWQHWREGIEKQYPNIKHNELLDKEYSELTNIMKDFDRTWAINVITVILQSLKKEVE